MLFIYTFLNCVYYLWNQLFWFNFFLPSSTNIIKISAKNNVK